MSSYIFIAILGFIGGIGIGRSVHILEAWRRINSLIQEIKQDPSISISQRNYAIKKMEELLKLL